MKVTEMRELISSEAIENKIYLIRGHKVMLGRDLARLYGVETRILNQSIKRNIKRLPLDFMFPLTREEIMNLSQIVISSKIKHAPNIYVFTEQGVTMLSSVLRSERAIQVNIAIMRAFVKLREILSTHKELAKRFEELERKMEKQGADIRLIFEAIRKLMEPPEIPKRRIGFHAD